MRCAIIQATGVLDELTLAHYDRSARALGAARQFRSSLQALIVTGTASEEGGKLQLNLNVIASRQRDNGIELLGGVCLAARAVSCEFVIEALDDVILRREIDRGTGLHPWCEVIAALPTNAAGAGIGGALASAAPAPALQEQASFSDQRSPPTLTAGTKPSWADAVMASVRAAADQPPEAELDEQEGPERIIRPGDILDHQQFGRCVVQRVDAGEEFVTVRLRNNRIVRLNLEVLNPRFQGEEEGHQVFATGAGGE